MSQRKVGNKADIKQILEEVRGLDPILSNPSRLLIMTILFTFGSQYEHEIQKLSGLSWGALFSHLKTLERAGYIRKYRVLTLSGPRNMIKATSRGIEAYRNFLKKVLKLTSTIKI